MPNCTPNRYDWSNGFPRAPHRTPWRRLILDTIVFGWCIGGLVLMCLLLFACGGVPQSLSLDPTFTPAEVAAIGDARNQWCDANGWCPSFVTDGEAHIVRDTTMSFDPTPGGKNVSGNTDQATNRVKLNAGKLDAMPEIAWLLIAHEMGHLQGIAHHGAPDCTMYFEHEEPAFALTCEGR